MSICEGRHNLLDEKRAERQALYQTKYCALRKYGKDNFETEILEDNVPLENPDASEIYFIVYCDCIAPKDYNRTRAVKVNVVLLNATHEKMRK